MYNVPFLVKLIQEWGQIFKVKFTDAAQIYQSFYMEKLKWKAQRHECTETRTEYQIESIHSCVWAGAVSSIREVLLPWEGLKGFFWKRRGEVGRISREWCSLPCHCGAINYLFLCFQAKHRPSFWHSVRAWSGICSPVYFLNSTPALIHEWLIVYFRERCRHLSLMFAPLACRTVAVRLHTGPDFLVRAELPPTIVTRATSSPPNIPQQSAVMYVQIKGQLLFQSREGCRACSIRKWTLWLTSVRGNRHLD